jgi:hypothetical protein
MFCWSEPILYLYLVSKFLETKERSGYFVGLVDYVGGSLTFKIMKNDLLTLKHRSVVISVADANHRNKRLSFKPDVQESFKSLDTKPSFLSKDSYHKCKCKKTMNEVSNRTSSEEYYTAQHIGSRTR